MAALDWLPLTLVLDNRRKAERQARKVTVEETHHFVTVVIDQEKLSCAQRSQREPTEHPEHLKQTKTQ
jgi:hypothetical protein